jgi:hypothetical protein
VNGIGVTTPATDEIHRKAAEIVARPDYELQPRHENLDWLTDFLWEALLWVLTPFAWLFGLTEGLPMFVRWLIIIVLVAILALLVWHILYSLVQAMQAPRRRAQLEQDALRGRPDPAELERQAEAAAAQSDYITAVRLLFRADVLHLEKFEDKPNRPGTTNRELLRRYQRHPSVADSLRSFVDMIDRKWYGEEQCVQTDYAVCRLAHEAVRRHVQGGAHVHGA